MDDTEAHLTLHVSTGNRMLSSSLIVPEDELDEISVLLLKQKVAEMLKPVLKPDELSCHIDGADLDDDWMGIDFGACEVMYASHPVCAVPCIFPG
jgi:hypothetical protein